MKLKVKILILVIFIISCNKEFVEKPNNLIPEDEMVNILFDIAILKSHQSLSVSTNDKDEVIDFPEDYVFKKYEIDSLQLSQSNIYYASKPEQHIRIFTKVFDRINSEKELIIKEKDSLSSKNEKTKPIKKTYKRA